MKNNEYPVGNPIFFKDNRSLDSIFGLVYAEVTTPKDIYAPILLYRNNSNFTLAPTGKWTGWFVSEELKNAVKYGYQVDIKYGYHYKSKAYLFDKYVDTLYEMRLTYPKADPMNLICKLLLNSLYGRFGLNPSLQMITTTEEYDPKYLLDTKKLVNNTLYFYPDDRNRDLTTVCKQEDLLISLPLAMFTTAYARIFMSKFKMEYQNNLYYSDTDSLYLDCSLPDEYIGPELGKFKLEYQATEVVFLAPKVYSLLLPDGSEITKVKGSTVLPSFSELKELLYNQQQIKLPQERWNRNISKGNISITDTIYTLTLNENKRIFTHNSEGIIIDTQPIKL